MQRNEWADRFADNVVRRTELDNRTSVYVVLLLLVLPPLIAAGLSAFLIVTNQDVFDDPRDLTIALVATMIGECCIASFLLFSINRSARKHQRRDMEWMDALIGYVESKGRDASGMREIRDHVRITGWKVKGVFSGLMFAIGIVILLATAVMSYLGVEVFSENTVTLLVITYVILLIQFVFTMGTTIRFPYRHDKAQCKFTEALSVQMRDIGIQCDPMKGTIHRWLMVVHIVLFVITLGLYSSVLILLTIHRLNRHIKKQWEYEERLLRRIVEFEGGTGIEGVGYNQPRNAAARFLKNSM